MPARHFYSILVACSCSSLLLIWLFRSQLISLSLPNGNDTNKNTIERFSKYEKTDNIMTDIKRAAKPIEKRYMHYFVNSGWNNQRLYMEAAVLAAMSLNATLVLPFAAIGSRSPRGWAGYKTLKIDQAGVWDHCLFGKKISGYLRSVATCETFPEFLDFDSLRKSFPNLSMIGAREYLADTNVLEAAKLHGVKKAWNMLEKLHNTITLKEVGNLRYPFRLTDVLEASKIPCKFNVPIISLPALETMEVFSNKTFSLEKTQNHSSPILIFRFGSFSSGHHCMDENKREKVKKSLLLRHAMSQRIADRVIEKLGGPGTFLVGSVSMIDKDNIGYSPAGSRIVF